ncbi:MAG: GGDEF domain-containing protein [Fimbriimonadales bacterium]|nr:GGDEF domain-containing protein [Fimbriimonadales bacterium]
MNSRALAVVEGQVPFPGKGVNHLAAPRIEREPPMRTIAHLVKPVRVWVNPDHTVETALILLRGHGLSGLPVIESAEICGVVEAQQLLGTHLEQPVRSVMQTEILIPSPDTPLKTVAEWLTQNRLTVLPVVQEGQLIGLLSVFDLLPEIGRSYDPMTGLPWSDLLREWSIEQLAAGREITVLFFDLDNFGMFNKRYGHLVGDEVLRRVAQVLLQETDPQTEVVCRWGGDEFAIATLRRREEAGLLAHHISRQIAALQLPEVDTPITASYGYQGGKRTREREQVHYAATVDNLINLASQECLLMKGAQGRGAGAQLTLPMQAVAEARPVERRVRIQSVSYEREGRRARARVYLQVDSTPLGGSAEGEANLHRLVAEAMLDALRRLLPSAIALTLVNITETAVDVGHTIVSAVLLWESEELRQELVGSAFLREDAPRSVASAVLDALNRPLAQILKQTARSE